MRKRDSVRRWKARCDLGQVITKEVIEEHRLTRWFVFASIDEFSFLFEPRFRKAEISL